MKKQTEIIEAFLEMNFERCRGEFDARLNDDEYLDLWKKEQEYYHSLFHKSTIRNYRPNVIKKFVDDVDAHYENEMKSIAKRPLLNIVKYDQAKLGDALARVFDDTTVFIYSTALGKNLEVESKFDNDMKFYWTNTDEGFKIIYWKFFFDDKWDHSSNFEPMMIHDDGKEVERIDFDENE